MSSLPHRRVLLSHAICLACLASLPAAERMAIAYDPGCLAKVSIMPGWPIEKLPDAPAEIVRLTALPEVEAEAKGPRTGHPNHLIDPPSGILDQARHYVVEFEGWILAEQDGIHTITVQSDDPVSIWVEGQLLAESDYTAADIPLEEDEKQSSNPVLFDTIQGMARLAGGKWYHVTILCRQQWAPWSFGHLKKNSSDRFLLIADSFAIARWDWYKVKEGREALEIANTHPLALAYNRRRGAHFKAWLARPTRDPVGAGDPLELYLPVIE